MFPLRGYSPRYLVVRQDKGKKHTSVRAAVHRDFVKPGTISVEFGKLYNSLLRDREEADGKIIFFTEGDKLTSYFGLYCK